MSPKHQRLTFIAVALLLGAAAIGMILNAFEENLVFFLTPTELIEKQVQAGSSVRTGGLVKEGSVIKAEDGLVTFIVTDLTQDLTVTYDGTLPALFREGQGIVVEGALQESGQFQASKVLAKHDENYMSPEVKKALEKSGVWQGDKVE